MNNKVLIFVVLLITACTESEFSKNDHPALHTLPTSEINKSGALVSAKITPRGDEKITSYGFIWGNHEFISLQLSNRKIYQGAPKSLIFSEELSFGHKSEDITYYKAFITTKSYTIFGDIQSFYSRGSLPPIIYDLSPSKAKIGDKIQLIGKNFSYSIIDNQVFFGNKRALLFYTTDTTITAIVPKDIPDTCIVKCNVLGKEAFADLNFIKLE